MNRHQIVTLSAIAALGLSLLTGTSVAQTKSVKGQLVGAWTLVSWIQTRLDGSKNYRFGTDPRGINTFDVNGHFSLIITRSDLPRVSSGDADKVTAEEAQAITKGSIGYFGTYTIEEDKTLSLHLEGTSLVNQIGIEQKRVITSISAEELKYRNPTAVGGGQLEVVWKRAK
jgi:Lipocalin-like domain